MNGRRSRRIAVALVGMVVSAGLLVVAHGDADAAAPSYKLPWDDSEVWRVTTGLHSTRAWDFDILGGPSNPEVLAITDGTARIICNQAGQATVRLRVSGSSDFFDYLHLSTGSVENAGLTSSGVSVKRGKVLGRLLASPPTTNTGCGHTNGGAHLHLKMPRLPITIDGVTFSASGPNTGTDLRSTNQRCTTACTTPPPGNRNRWLFDLTATGGLDPIWSRKSWSPGWDVIVPVETDRTAGSELLLYNPG